MDKNIIIIENPYWKIFYHKDRKDFLVTGKYLFFSKKYKVLYDIAMHELVYGGIISAKINTGENKTGADYVLCLYYIDDSKKHTLAEKYKYKNDVAYRYWKSNEDTAKGKYSDKYINESFDIHIKQQLKDLKTHM